MANPEDWGTRPFAAPPPTRYSPGMQIHHRLDSCTTNFQELARELTIDLQRRNNFINSLIRLQICFDDRYWFQRYSYYCGQWNEEPHREQTRKILQMYYTLKFFSDCGVIAGNLEITHTDNPPYFGYFTIFNAQNNTPFAYVGNGGFTAVINYQGAPGTPGGRMPRGPFAATIDMIDRTQEYEPFGDVPAPPPFKSEARPGQLRTDCITFRRGSPNPYTPPIRDAVNPEWPIERFTVSRAPLNRVCPAHYPPLPPRAPAPPPVVAAPPPPPPAPVAPPPPPPPAPVAPPPPAVAVAPLYAPGAGAGAGAGQGQGRGQYAPRGQGARRGQGGPPPPPPPPTAPGARGYSEAFPSLGSSGGTRRAKKVRKAKTRSRK